jgi:hypothetical protein
MSAEVGYSLGSLTLDQLDFVHAAPLCALVAAANGRVDLNRIARQELANRGYDRYGIWVGFKRAKSQYQEDVSGDSGARSVG